MRSPLVAVLVPFLGLTAALPAQTGEVLRFDEGCGPDTLAYPLGVTNASAFQKQIFTFQPSSSWAAGRWGSALRGCEDPTVTGSRNASNFVRVGNRSPSGDLTMAFWIRERVGVSRRQHLVLGQPFIQLLADRPSGALEMVFSQPNLAILRTQTNIFSLASGRWVHVAVVHDATNLTLTLYIDGSVEATASLTAPVSFSPSWTVGHQGSSACYYDIDEFFSDGRALTASEVSNLRAYPVAGVGEFPGGCSSLNHAMSLEWIGTAPTLGATGTIRATTEWPAATIPPGSAVAISFGDDRCQYRGLQLPFDLSTIFQSLPRCTLVHNQNLLIVSAAIGASGRFDIPLTVPNNALTLPLYAQAFVIESNGTLRISNGLALAIGN